MIASKVPWVKVIGILVSAAVRGYAKLKQAKTWIAEATKNMPSVKPDDLREMTNKEREYRESPGGMIQTQLDPILSDPTLREKPMTHEDFLKRAAKEEAERVRDEISGAAAAKKQEELEKLIRPEHPQ